METSVIYHLRQQLHAAVLACDLPKNLLEQQDPALLLEGIRKVCNNGEVRRSVSNYGNAMRTLLQQEAAARPGSSLRVISGKLLANQALLAVSHRYRPGMHPLVHHWIPRCYLKRWAAKPQQRGKIVRVPQLRFSGTDPEETLATDYTFAHGKVKNKGFYQLELEYFFSRLEADFDSIARGDILSPKAPLMAKAALMLFISAQLLRNVNTGSVALSSFRNVIEGMVEKLEHFENPQMTLVLMETTQPFAPWAMDRLFGTTGGPALVFPLAPTKVVVISGAPLTEAELKRVVEHSRRARISSAKQQGLSLYGLTAAEL
jgi:hypothetical protein